jgi:hypothetical protein
MNTMQTPQTKQAGHTQWRSESRSMSDNSLVIKDSEHNVICVIRNGEDRNYGPENDKDIEHAHRIVRAVNSHEKLLGALQAVFGEWLKGKTLDAGSPEYDLVRNAIAHATRE